MSQRLIFADAPAAADALTFAGRSARVGDGAVRLAAAGGTLTMTAAPFAPRGLFDATPTVLAMRALPVDPELVCDLVVEASELAGADDSAEQLQLPETAPLAVMGGRVAAARRVVADGEHRGIRPRLSGAVGDRGGGGVASAESR